MPIPGVLDAIAALIGVNREQLLAKFRAWCAANPELAAVEGEAEKWLRGQVTLEGVTGAVKAGAAELLAWAQGQPTPNEPDDSALGGG